MANAERAQPVLTARAAGLVGCSQCGHVHPRGTEECSVCGAHLQSRDKTSLQRVWAWLFAGMVVYIPANVYPMLRTSTLGHTTESTIVGGVFDLADHGAYGIALIVFVASVVIPVSKFIAIAYLAIRVQRGLPGTPAHFHLYEVVEFIGRWSMIDVFVVAILSALVQLDFVASINPGIAAVSFALSVAFTMISANSFDPKLIWDSREGAEA
ncbi:paraquat-inducible protein A [Marivita sp. GX14005]|uniref:paraquat-inducible protein A n=1 Tax=Marivita sp. GX14005 TaxID=2942276 RepID=UPI00201A21AD|nr:paraquat-inducible protein A [Marivita sp. GX14005]MCL3880788.1 paraquat-inducible protein A [Marivita sp. GX14005]